MTERNETASEVRRKRGKTVSAEYLAVRGEYEKIINQPPPPSAPPRRETRAGSPGAHFYYFGAAEETGENTPGSRSLTARVWVYNFLTEVSTKVLNSEKVLVDGELFRMKDGRLQSSRNILQPTDLRGREIIFKTNVIVPQNIDRSS